MKQVIFILCLIFSQILQAQQSFKFAQVTDTHVGGATGADDLRRTVKDLNTQTDIDFVILSGDVTEFGSDQELALAKQILDSLHLPLYVIPGNHDSNWSESGANSFRRVFAGETFFFRHKGYQFMGTTSGPNMRMGPGQIPRENLLWMDSIFTANPDKETPLIYINHYPQDSSLNNWYEAIDRLKTRNVQLLLCGHGHINKQYDWEGIPGVMGRSNLRAKDTIGGYNIISVGAGYARYAVRRPLVKTEPIWAEVPLKKQDFGRSATVYKRPNYAVNDRYSDRVEEVWRFQDDADLGAGFATYKNLAITANTAGRVYALDLRTGKKIWSYQTGGKVYATPAVWKNYLVVGSSDGFIYGLDARNGALRWKLVAKKAVLGSALLVKGVAYVGASDSVFRAIDVKTGKLLWHFDEVKGYVSAKPTWADNQVVFGSWGNGFYALDARTGKLNWSWDNGQQNRMFSAAACYPVFTAGRLFIVAPDRYMTCLSAKSGEVIWREKRDSIRVRESMGLAKHEQVVYVKTMDGNLLGVSTDADKMDVTWQSNLQLPYELAPSAIETNGKSVFVPSHAGLLSAVNSVDGKLEWQYKFANALINPILILKNGQLLASSMDGVIIKLQIKE
ncbi:PQQ-binding-like beta-propeller repeat protein [Sphingobacterium oryzagri]|uniref:PQQ-binding-like beta-propeller repeat protein n=1 Tax=Sphingobacterium oryzagri TaxID=3025669 RepID=A0ABY7WIW9_9SPHI|nr:PQQ-binding-like beta-propeller repeat protein [Sphingobacterium sp. KACC 22765]WDF68925.1 PQQ-binding-like beta-propeller repeat protein [Sphingobacterium sp. KACC 22765]